MSRRLALASTLCAPPALLVAGCCVNPFINTDRLPAGAPGTPEAEVGDSLAEAEPAHQATESGEGAAAGFDLRLVRVEPGVHLETEQFCDVIAALRLETITRTEDEPTFYDDAATQRMSVRCTAPTGESWADVQFTATDASHAPEIATGVRIRIRVRTADGGFFDYPIVDYVSTIGPSPALRAPRVTDSGSATLSTGFDLRAMESDPSLVGTTQECAISHAGEVELVEPAEARRRSYPAGVQNRITIRCRHSSGEEWGDLVFMPSQALSALHVGRGDVVRVTLVSRNGGAFDYPVLQFVGS